MREVRKEGQGMTYSPKGSLQLLESIVLSTLEYSPSQLVRNFTYASESEGRIRADLVAFSDEYRHDLATACIAVQWCPDAESMRSALGQLRYLAAPVGLLAGPESVKVFAIKETPTDKPLADLRYEDVSGYFSSNRLSFSSESLLAIKTGSRQLTWFDMDPGLIQFAEAVSQRLLVRRFEGTVRAGLRARHNRSTVMDSSVIRSAIRLLAARVLEDKGTLSNRTQGAESLLRSAKSRFPDYFNLVDFEHIGWDIADEMLSELSGGLTYQAFSNELLGHLYENALVDPSIRKEFGVYYTPRYLAQAIVDRLPIEEIPEDERFVMDGTCGSGNLLLAGYERLKRLLPTHMDAYQKHQYLTQHIWGIDRDEFASEAARLALLLFSLPLGNSWNIHAADFLRDDVRPFYPSAPRIIVGNPPFRHFRGDGEVNQIAKRFVEQYLDHLHPGGMLSILLPETFLGNTNCSDVRRRVLTETEILEVWHLPAGAIPSSDIELAVLMLRKKESSHHPVRVRRVIGRVQDKEVFRTTLQATYDYLVPRQEEWLHRDDASMSSSHLNPMWRRLLRTCPQLGEQVREIASGLQLYRSPTDVKSSNRTHKRMKPWLEGSSDLLPYGISPQKEMFLDYDRVHRRRQKYQWMLDTEKVVMNATRARRHPWRIFAAVDRVGYYPDSSLLFSVPNANVSTEELTAVLNSPVINAWLDSFNLGRTLVIPTLKAAPYPSFTEDLRASVVDKVKEVERLRVEAPAELGSIRSLVRELDHLVYSGYGLTSSEIAELEQTFVSCSRPGPEWKNTAFVASVGLAHDEHIPESLWRVDGQVLEVNAESNTIRLSVRGINEGAPFVTEIPQNFPGWILREGVLFRADIPSSLLDSTTLPPQAFHTVVPQDFSFMSIEALEEGLIKRLLG